MILYLDTSALVPLLVEEPASDRCTVLWDAADSVVTTRLAYVETAAALAQAHRLGRLTSVQHADALNGLEAIWTAMEIVHLDAPLMRRAAGLASDLALRGYDAVHAAAAEALSAPNLVAASGDRELLRAWRELGLSTSDTNAP